MFRKYFDASTYRPCFPRVCGDVPTLHPPPQPSAWFSPRVRGCSCCRWAWGYWRGVFPACAGMFRRARRATHTEVSFPRARGDVPSCSSSSASLIEFSPRTRGCSSGSRSAPKNQPVFPAHAGMFLIHQLAAVCKIRFPRARGDVPTFLFASKYSWVFSPRTRGCSFTADIELGAAVVFPAHAGMFRRFGMCLNPWVGFPRARGDVPALGDAIGWAWKFSPRTRGCSARPQSRQGHGERFPRARGDVPCPRTSTRLDCSVFPAHAGMFRQVGPRRG